MKINFLDRAIAFVSPGIGYARLRQRMKVETLQRRYEGASQGRRTGDWSTPSTSANTELAQDVVTLRNRSREMVRNNGLARNIVQRVLPNSIVGTGIIPAPKALGKAGTSTAASEALNAKVKQLWEAWAGETHCDYSENTNFSGLQHQAIIAIIESGGVFLRRVYNTAKKDFPLEIQVLEIDFLDRSKHSLTFDKDGITNRLGVQFNKKGKLTGYWLYKNHPGDGGINESTLVDAKDIVHLYAPERPGQIEGAPWLSPVLITIKDLKDYEDSELVKQKIASCFSVFVKSDGVDETTDKYKDYYEKPDLRYDHVEPGIIQTLNPGDTVEVATPPVNAGYDAHVRNVNRKVSSGMGSTYEAATSDYSNVNFSSGRMGRLEMQGNIEVWQWLMIIPKMRKVWGWFIDMCILTGRLPEGTEVPVDWTPPRKQMIDPLKEIQAKILAVKSGFTSLQQVLREDGYQPEEVMKKIKEDKEMAAKYGLVLMSDFANDPAYLTAIKPPPVTTQKESKPVS